MKKYKAIQAIMRVVFVVMVCAIPTVVSAQSAIGIFCNGKGGVEFNQNWNLERNGTGDPGKKFLNYYITLSDNPTGSYAYTFSSFWGFKFFAYQKAPFADTWKLTYTDENPKTATDRDGRRYNYVNFIQDAPRDRPTQSLIQITANPYDPALMMNARVVSSNCTQGSVPPSSNAGCQWVDTMLGQPLSTPYCSCNGVVVANSRCGRP